MRYAASLALSMTTLTRCVIASALAAEAVALLGGAPLRYASQGAAVFAAIGLPAVAPPTDESGCVALAAPEAPG